MFKILSFVLILFLGTNSSIPVMAEENYTPYYYRIDSANCYLYRTAEDNQDVNNIWFLLPKTYFVQLIEDSDEQFFKVKYQNFIGYVFKTDVSIVYETPKTPWPENLTFDINGTANVVMRSSPSSDSEYIGLIPFNAIKVTFYGSIIGQEALTNLGNQWYYATYKSYEQGIISGYVYAPLTTNLTLLQDNTEILSTIKPTSGPSIEEVISPELQDSQNLLIIGLLSIVGISVLILLFIPKKRTKKAKQAIKNTNITQHHQKQELTFDDLDDM